MSNDVRAIVLAAGLSSRMGTPKQLLPFGGATVLQRVVGVLCSADVAAVHVVVGHLAEDVTSSLSRYPVQIVPNPEFESGMFSSVLAGLNSLPVGTHGMMVALGDQPQISRGVVDALLDAYRGTPRGIVVPVWAGQRGHPVVIDVSRYGEEIRSLPGTQGMKPVVRGHPEDTLECPVGDADILRDIDTPEDYRKALAAWEAKGEA